MSHNVYYSSFIDNVTQRGNEMATTYQLIDIQTQKLIKTYASRDAATKAADSKDRAYGAVRYIVKPIFDNSSTVTK